MRQLPGADPGQPDISSANRYLWWTAKKQWLTLVGGMVFGIIWMATLAIMPALLGKAIDEGVANQDQAALVSYLGWLAGVGAINAVAGIVRHRFAVTNWLSASYLMVQVVGRHAVKLGATLPRKTATGEVTAIGTSDLSNIGHVMDVSARFSGAVFSYLLVSVILLQSSVSLGLLVLIGVPVLMLAVSPLLKPLQLRALDSRALMGELSNTANDIVSGLRILRGIGGEDAFFTRYRAQSQRTKDAGIAVAKLQSTLDSLQVLLPGVFVVLVVWVGARFAIAGEISLGELVAFYGYAAFLIIPLRTVTEFVSRFIRGRVTAGRVVAFLSLTPDVAAPVHPAQWPGPDAVLTDARTGLRIRPGQSVGIVCENSELAAALADRLGMMSAHPDRQVCLADIPLADFDRAELRRHLVISDTAAVLFSGTVAALWADSGASPQAVRKALSAAAADDIIEGLPEGLNTYLAEGGRTLSGGQRQRLVLARALGNAPEILILVEPTSAVDAHTEAIIAQRLPAARAGKTTLVMTSSPLLLAELDRVVLMTDGRVAAAGTHQQLVATNPHYQQLVFRGSLDLADAEVAR